MKKRTWNVMILFVSVAFCGVPWQGFAGETHTHEQGEAHEHLELGVDEVLERVLADPAWRPDFEAEAEAIRAGYEVELHRSWPGTQLMYEQIFGDTQVAMSQLTWSASQRFDWSNWRDDLKGARVHDEAALAAKERVWRLELEYTVQQAYFEALYYSRRHDVHEAWLRRLEASRESVSLRQERGDDSLYSVKRIEREIELVRARHATEHMSLAAAQATLLAWLALPPDEPLDLTGVLLPGAPLQPGGVFDVKHPEVERLEQMEQAMQVRAQSMTRLWMRGWEVEAGVRLFNMSNSLGQGFIVGVSAPLALWDQEEDRQDVWEARAAEVAGKKRVMMSHQERAEQVALTQLIEALDVLARMTPTTADASITQLAELAYSEGELTLAELLDAHQSETELEIERVELAWRARQAKLELDRVRGGRR